MSNPETGSPSKDIEPEDSIFEQIESLRPIESISPIARILSGLGTILVPIALVLTAVRLLLTPAFVQFEYRTPNFPPDPYGFTQGDRLHWSQIALDYLLNDEGIDFLADLRFEDGTPLYNQRELGHMVDVKNVVQAALYLWYGTLIGLIGLGVLAWRGKWWWEYREALARGGWATIYLVGSVIVFVLIGFGIFFVAFHQVFFDPGTWTFAFSDTLIRLFPERFWRDTFLVLGALAGGGGLVLAYIFRRQ